MKSTRYVFLAKPINVINSISCVYSCTKASLACQLLNRMRELGRPQSYAVS
jgi:hypothetical protein